MELILSGFQLFDIIPIIYINRTIYGAIKYLNNFSKKKLSRIHQAIISIVKIVSDTKLAIWIPAPVYTTAKLNIDATIPHETYMARPLCTKIRMIQISRCSFCCIISLPYSLRRRREVIRHINIVQAARLMNTNATCRKIKVSLIYVISV